MSKKQQREVPKAQKVVDAKPNDTLVPKAKKQQLGSNGLRGN